VLRIDLQRSLGILDLISLLKWVKCQSSKRYLPSQSFTSSAHDCSWWKIPDLVSGCLLLSTKAKFRIPTCFIISYEDREWQQEHLQFQEDQNTALPTIRSQNVMTYNLKLPHSETNSAIH